MNNYRIIQEAKDRAINRTRDSTAIVSEDKTSKTEYPNGRETYAQGFTDYHGPNENDRPPK